MGIVTAARRNPLTDGGWHGEKVPDFATLLKKRAQPLQGLGKWFVGWFGEGGGNRTHNLWIKSPLLCQLSYAPKPGSRLVTKVARSVKP